MKKLILLLSLLVMGCYTHKDLASSQSEMADYVKTMVENIDTAQDLKAGMNEVFKNQAASNGSYAFAYDFELLASVGRVHQGWATLMVWRPGWKDVKLVGVKVTFEMSEENEKVIDYFTMEPDPWK